MDMHVTPMLEVRHLSVQYGSYQILKDISFSLEEGEWLMLAGPNGAGKSTIVSAVSQSVPYQGEMLYQGRHLRSFRPKDLAREIGVLAQNHFLGYSFTVREVVQLGRYAYAGGVFGDSDQDGEEMIGRALEMTGMQPMENRSVLELSGGELQRVFLAQLFAQNPRLLILDEPTNHLDLVYQKQVFMLIKEWLKQKGRAVISVVHDLSLAKKYGTEGLLLHRGEILARGKIGEVFAPEHLEAAYSLDVYAWMQDMLGQWKQPGT